MSRTNIIRLSTRFSSFFCWTITCFSHHYLQGTEGMYPCVTIISNCIKPSHKNNFQKTIFPQTISLWLGEIIYSVTTSASVLFLIFKVTSLAGKRSLQLNVLLSSTEMTWMSDGNISTTATVLLFLPVFIEIERILQFLSVLGSMQPLLTLESSTTLKHRWGCIGFRVCFHT